MTIARPALLALALASLAVTPVAGQVKAPPLKTLARRAKALESYRAKRHKLVEKGDASGLVRLARWCGQQGLIGPRRDCLRLALRPQPTKSSAQRALDRLEATAEEHRSAERPWHLTSKRLEVTSNGEQALAYELHEAFGSFLAAFEARFKVTLDPRGAWSQPLRLRAFARRAALDAYLEAAPEVERAAPAARLPALRELVVAAQPGDPAATCQALFRASTPWLLELAYGARARTLPRWFVDALGDVLAGSVYDPERGQLTFLALDQARLDSFVANREDEGSADWLTPLLARPAEARLEGAARSDAWALLYGLDRGLGGAAKSPRGGLAALLERLLREPSKPSLRASLPTSGPLAKQLTEGLGAIWDELEALAKSADEDYQRSHHAAARRSIARGLARSPLHPDLLGVSGQIDFDFGSLAGASRKLAAAAARSAEVWGQLALDVQALIAFLIEEDGRCRTLVETMTGAESVAPSLTALLSPDGLRAHRSPRGRYIIYLDEALEEQGGAGFAAGVMDTVFRAYAKVFPFRRNDLIISRVYIFSDTDAFAAFSAELGEDEAETTAGYYAPASRVLVINADPGDAAVNDAGFCAEAINTMFHEGFHQFFDFYAPDVPLWFNEGLAEYFGPSHLRKRGELQVGVVQKHDDSGLETRYETLLAALQDDDPVSVLSLRALIAQSTEDFNESAERVNVNYAQCWAVLHFLLHDKSLKGRGVRAVKRLFTALRAGLSTKEAQAQAFEGLDFEALDTAWRRYVLSL